MKNNIKEKKKGPNFLKKLNKRAYIALLVLAVLVSVSVIARNRAMKMMENQTSFDDEAWEAAVEESGVTLPEDNEPIEEDIADENAQDVSVTPVTAEAAPQESAPEIETAPAAAEEEELTFTRPSKGSVLKDFSGDELVYCETMEDWRTHNGIDFAAEVGTQVTAVCEGVVEKVYNDDMLGITVEIKHPDGTLSRYSGLQSLDFIAEGKEVSQGDIIGGVGESGLLEEGSEPHLHFEIVKDEEYQDPNQYFAK